MVLPVENEPPPASAPPGLLLPASGGLVAVDPDLVLSTPAGSVQGTGRADQRFRGPDSGVVLELALDPAGVGLGPAGPLNILLDNETPCLALVHALPGDTRCFVELEPRGAAGPAWDARLEAPLNLALEQPDPVLVAGHGARAAARLLDCDQALVFRGHRLLAAADPAGIPEPPESGVCRLLAARVHATPADDHVAVTDPGVPLPWLAWSAAGMAGLADLAGHGRVFSFPVSRGFVLCLGTRGDLTSLSLRAACNRLARELSAALSLADVHAEAREVRRQNRAFVYMVSHEMKAPLRGLNFHSRVLERDHGEDMDPEARRKLTRIRRLTFDLTEQMDALLRYSRLQRAEVSPEPASLEELVGLVLEHLGPVIAKAGAEVSTQNLPLVECDPEMTANLLAHLVRNAVTYNDSPRPRVDITAERTEQGWLFRVRDNGMGMSQTEADEAFTMFKRLHHGDEHGPGAGAGLALARLAAERQGGTMWIEAGPTEGGTGLDVCFTLAPGVAGT
jgi:signal transduction histidine kinase